MTRIGTSLDYYKGGIGWEKGEGEDCYLASWEELAPLVTNTIFFQN